MVFCYRRTGPSGVKQQLPLEAAMQKNQLPKWLKRVSRGETVRDHLLERIREMQEWQEKDGPTLGPDLKMRELREAGRRV
jgi:hypothetical protein